LLFFSRLQLLFTGVKSEEEENEGKLWNLVEATEGSERIEPTRNINTGKF
jgi:hypothetical protein